jgi:hypothetical protein
VYRVKLSELREQEREKLTAAPQPEMASAYD